MIGHRLTRLLVRPVTLSRRVLVEGMFARRPVAVGAAWTAAGGIGCRTGSKQQQENGNRVLQHGGDPRCVTTMSGRLTYSAPIARGQ